MRDQGWASVPEVLAWWLAVMTTPLVLMQVGCASPPDDPAVIATQSAYVVTYRSGTDGYTGTLDGQITSQGASGVGDYTSNNVLLMRNTIGGYESEALIRFNGISIPPGTRVTAASVSLSFEDFAGGHVLRAYYLLSPWTTAAKWVPRATGLSWNVPGAKGVGTDRSAMEAFSDATWAGSGYVTKTYALDPAVVQGWLDDPASNLGLVLVNDEVANRVLRYLTADHATASRRPALTIAYAPPGCTPTGPGAWSNEPFSPQTGSFTVELDATPSTSNLDAVMGLSEGARTAVTGLAVLPRFDATGFITARNGSDDQAVTQVPYSGGAHYHFRIVVDVTDHTYSAYVTPPGGTEQTIAEDYSFTSEQTAVSSLDNLATHVETATGSVMVCNLAVTTLDPEPADTESPSASMTAPTSGSTVSGTIELSASASDDEGVAGVQFLVDGNSAGAEVTTPPYAISFDTTTLANGPHAFAARARDAAGNTGLATAVTVTVSNTSGLAAHPRIWLDPATLAAVTERALSTDPAINRRWFTLRDKCNQYLLGVVRPMPVGANCVTECSTSGPDICCGFQGSKLHPAVLNLGLCYQIGLQIDHPNTDAWGNKGIEVLTEMSRYTHYSGNSGYQIRFIATALAIGYDWLYPKLTATLKAELIARMKGWIAWPESQPDKWGAHHPVGDFFAGWYAAKAYTALAMEGDDPDGATMWRDWLDRVHGGGPSSLTRHAGVAAYHTAHLDGGGFPGGWQYGGLAVRNMCEPALAARSAKHLNLINGTAPSFEYPLNTALHLIHFTWPSRLYLDDRDTIKLPAGCPGNPHPRGDLVTTLTAVLAKSEWQQSFNAQFQDYAKTIRDLHGGTTNEDTPQQWLDLLFWDETAPRQSFATLPREYLSERSYLAMRSDWTTSATWASFRATPILDGNSHQYPDAGSLVITRGDTPFLVNPNFLMRCYPGTSTSWFNHIDTDVHGLDTRQLFNVFYTGTTSGQHYTAVDAVSAPATAITRFDPHGDYVFTRAQDLEDQYAGVTSWSRDVLYLRVADANLFVVYDRTSAACGAPRLAWHFPPAPTENGAGRYDIADAAGGFKGSIASALIATPTSTAAVSAAMSVDNVFASNKLYRVNITPSTCATDLRWVTVLDAAASAAAVHGRTPLNLTNAKGVILAAADRNKIALFGAGAAGEPIAGSIVFDAPAVTTTTLVVADLLPGTTYAVSAPVDDGTHRVTISPGASGFTTSAAGVLHVDISSAGVVTTGN